MRAALLIMTLATSACGIGYEGVYAANVSTTIRGTTTATNEDVELLETNFTTNEIAVSRFAGACVLKGFKRGGFGCDLNAGQTCERDGLLWTLDRGGAENQLDGDDLIIDLEWTRGDGETVRESLRLLDINALTFFI